jgi:hypothetical protein
VSLLPTERLSIGLCPTQVGIRYSRRGWRRKDDRQALIDVPATENGQTAWQAALESLDHWLSEAKISGAATTLVLSNAFLRFVMVPWSDASTTEEESALARACFETRYGDMASWSQALDNDGNYGEPRIAVALDTALLDALRELFAHHCLVCRSVRPAFVAAWNRNRKELAPSLGNGDGAFVLAESGTVVVATRKAGAWHSLRALASAIDDKILPVLLEREALLQGFGEPLPAWVVAPGISAQTTTAHHNPEGDFHWVGSESLSPAAALAAWGMEK